ncbi:caspase domain-containing protein [Desarmillaria tabescens]|uniref:Caspase domain-containing protein n=1 Tax=Armillaria tabescens TaxID=1929756 RepID=A0AA39NPM2_ARMTA|nr:caspase domain-containing protein [Desarmillaria tabescens]KAK0469385.1 caspase domain-containing protein [Desarmillaria tabescens]
MQNDTPAQKFHIGEKPSDTKVATAPDAPQTATNSDSKEVAQAPASFNDKIFALIIGISEYYCPKYPKLPGAAPDAGKIYEFVRGTLHVPEKNIINLRNEQATREAIIQSFRRLEENTEIIQGDAAIIIYYAGHGAMALKPVEWKDWYTPDNTIELLCPFDMMSPESDSHEGEDKVKVEGIPDRTISSLLLDLSTARGNNITLVLDCCHSAGINRGAPHSNPSAIPRQILDPQTISPECDSDIYDSRTRKSNEAPDCSGFSGLLWDSHILLAACSRHQSAWEINSAGVFTEELLRVMRKRSLVELTYRSLMDNLIIPSWASQTPHQEGNVVRHLFDPSGNTGDASMIACRREVTDGRLRLSLGAGDVLGITPGSKYQICSTDLLGAPSLGIAVVEAVTSESSSFLTPSDPQFFTNNKDFRVGYARLANAVRPNLLAYGQDLRFLEAVLGGDNQAPFDIPVIITSKENEADLCILVERDSVSFRRGQANSYYRKDGRSFHLMKGNSLFTLMEPRLTPGHTSEIGKDVAQVRQIITLYANFTYHITNKSRHPITRFASIQMHELQHNGPNLNKFGENLIPDLDKKLVKVPVDMSLPNCNPYYGFTIKNLYGINLYAYLFYFDPSTLDIECWYNPQMGTVTNNRGVPVDTCLPPHSELTLGFGNNFMDPAQFNVPEGRDIDICCFKFYVAVKPLNLGSIEQSYNMSRGATRQPQHLDLRPDDSWASVVIPILQERCRNESDN